MKVKEREAWVALNEGKGGKRPSFDEFNKSFKGQERNPRANEFASMDVEEYHHYSERAEYNYDKDDNSKSKQEQKQDSKRSSTSNVVKNVVGRVVAVAASAVVIVSAYTAMTVVSSQNWVWSNDNQSAIIELVGSDGSVLRELSADVTVEQEDPTCNHTGLKTYTATAIDEDEEVYTDIRYETLDVLGHDAHIVEQTIANGTITIVYECSRCHEQFTATIDINEND